MSPDSTASNSRPLLSAERLKAFTDAVVAIAMTLLILPLVESIAQAAHEHLHTLEWLSTHSGQILSFVLSFALIAEAWMGHHLLFDTVHQTTAPLVWLSVLWMATIVFFPVPTAMIGSMEPDGTQKSLYIGTLLLTQLALLLSRLHLRRRPDLHEISPEHLRANTLTNVIRVALIIIILVVATAIPGGNGYFALTGLALIGPLHVAARRLRSR